MDVSGSQASREGTRRWPVVQPSLADGLIRLRSWLPEDAASVFRACQDADIQYFTQVPAPYLREHAEQFVAQSRDHWFTGHSANFAVTDHSTDTVLGSCSLLNVDALLREAEAGYWVAPWARSRGIARHALLLITEWALGDGGLDRVFLKVEDANYASTIVALNSGFNKVDGPWEVVEIEGRTRHFSKYERLRSKGS
ncbi:MAG TPA: GNAT family N-acetyltransferase [Acidothermaceae bacterium]